MKFTFIALSCFFVFNCFSQSKNILGIGLERMNYTSEDSNLQLIDDSYEGVYVQYDWVSERAFGVGVEGRYALTGPIYFDGRLKAGYTLNNGKRLQFPIYPYGGFYVLQEEPERPSHSGVLWGIQGGIRFYITDNISVQGSYHYTSHGVNRIGSNNYEKNIAAINVKGISVGILYYLGD